MLYDVKFVSILLVICIFAIKNLNGTEAANVSAAPAQPLLKRTIENVSKVVIEPTTAPKTFTTTADAATKMPALSTATTIVKPTATPSTNEEKKHHKKKSDEKLHDKVKVEKTKVTTDSSPNFRLTSPVDDVDGRLFDAWYVQRDEDELHRLKKRAALADSCQAHLKQVEHELHDSRSERDSLLHDKERLKSKLKESKSLINALERSLAALEDAHQRDLRQIKSDADEWRDRALKTKDLMSRWS